MPRVPSFPAQEFRLIRESSYGVPDAAGTWRKMNAMALALQPTLDTDPFAASGNVVPSIISINDDYAQGSIDGRGDYETIPYILSSLFGPSTISTPGGGTNSRHWDYLWTGRGQVVPQSYTVSTGTEQMAETTPGVIFNGFSLDGDREGMELGSTIWGKSPNSDFGLGGYVAVEQVIHIEGAPTGGDFTLSVLGGTTVGIAYNASAANVATALNTVLTAVGSDYTATGADGPLPGDVTITFAGGTGDLGLLIPDSSGLTGGGGAYNEVIVEEGAGATDSATDINPQPMFPLHFSVYMSPSWATLGGAQYQLLHAYNMDLGFGDKYERTKPINRSRLSDSYVEIADQEHTLELTLAVDWMQRKILKDVQRGDRKFVRIEAQGPIIEGIIPYLFRLDMSLFIDEVGESEDLNNIYARPFTFRIGRDAVSGNAAAARVTNTRTAL